MGRSPWDQVPWYIAGEMVGAFIGAVLVYLHYFPHWAETEDADLKLAVFSTGPAIRTPAVEHRQRDHRHVRAGVRDLRVRTVGPLRNKAGLAALGPLPVAFLVLVIGLSLGGTTGYAINPARDLGPRIAHFLLPIPGKRDSDWGYSWIPVVGPLVGGALRRGRLQQLAFAELHACTAVIPGALNPRDART